MPMQHLDISVLNQSLSWLEQQPVWLCTVLRTYGSSPRSPGALMAATADGRFCGSLSGGCVEDDFLQRIGAGEYRAASQIVRYGEGGLTPGIALPCGGVLDILVEYLPAGEASATYVAKMLEALNGHFALQKRLEVGQPCRHLEVTDFADVTQVEINEQEITLHVAAAPRLLIAGLSSVALYCADFAQSLGFEVVVCENRPEALGNFVGQLKPGITLLKQFPANYLEQQNCHANTAIVALTHDPRMDDLTMMEAVNTPAFYIGVMGSQKNSAKRLDRLQNIAELSSEELKRIQAPIGLKLGSKTPAEIALAVMADIVKRKNEARG